MNQPDRPQQEQNQFISALYDISSSNRRKCVLPEEVGQSLGLTSEHSAEIANLLISKNLARRMTKEGAVAITQKGIQAIRKTS